MRVQLIFWCLIVCFALPSSLWAEFYRYTGEDGAVHFTDDLSQVPVDQREKVEAYSGAPAPSSPPVSTETLDDPKTAVGAKEAISLIEEQRQSLITRQEALEAEYERLMNVKAELEVLRKTADTPEKKTALNKKISDFQADIAKYEEQSKTLQEEVNAYNEAVKPGEPDATQTPKP